MRKLCGIWRCGRQGCGWMHNKLEQKIIYQTAGQPMSLHLPYITCQSISLHLPYITCQSISLHLPYAACQSISLHLTYAVCQAANLLLTYTASRHTSAAAGRSIHTAVSPPQRAIKLARTEETIPPIRITREYTDSMPARH